jgi:hypothetical protein
MSGRGAGNFRHLGGGRLPKGAVGLLSQLHWSLTFTQWAASLRGIPTVQQICDRFEVSRATGYRYRAAWEAAVAQQLVPAPTSLRAAYPTITGKHNER